MPTTVNVHGNCFVPNGEASKMTQVTATLSGFDVDAETGVPIPKTVHVKTDLNGDYTLKLWPNTKGTQDTYYSIATKYGTFGSALVPHELDGSPITDVNMRDILQAATN